MRWKQHGRGREAHSETKQQHVADHETERHGEHGDWAGAQKQTAGQNRGRKAHDETEQQGQSNTARGWAEKHTRETTLV